MNSLWRKIKTWYRGKEINLNDDNSSILILPGIRYQKHWTSKLVHAGINFYKDNWKWVWWLVIAIIGIILALVKT